MPAGGDRRQRRKRPDGHSKAAHDRCETQIRPRFDATIKWDQTGRVGNGSEVLALARELGLRVAINRDTALAAFKNAPPAPDNINIYDPRQHDRLILMYFGASRSTGAMCD